MQDWRCSWEHQEYGYYHSLGEWLQSVPGIGVLCLAWRTGLLLLLLLLLQQQAFMQFGT
jgi:hypothetical protein